MGNRRRKLPEGDYAIDARKLQLCLMQRPFSRLIFESEMGGDRDCQDADNTVDKHVFRTTVG